MIDGISALSIDTSAWTDPAQRAALDSLLTQIQGQVNALISSLGTNIQTSATGTRIVLTSPVATPAAGQVGAGDAAPIPFPFSGNWTDNSGVPNGSWYMRLACGLVFFSIQAKTSGGAGDTSACGAFPVTRRPSRIRHLGPTINTDTGLVASQGIINTNGSVQLNTGGAANLQWEWFGVFPAEQ